MAAYPSAYTCLYRWLLLAGFMAFGGHVAQREGLLQVLFESDRSYLSIVVLTVFLLTSLHAGYLALRNARQILAARSLTAAASTATLFVYDERTDGWLVGRRPEAHSPAHRHLALLARRRVAGGQSSGQEMLLERLENQIRQEHETGWFIADLMVRLGLLGTVIGFIFMLGSITTMTSADLAALQQLLSDMSSGMRVALYTTLTGLGAGILLSLQYQLLDRAADRLIAEIIELSEVHAAAHLNRLAAKPAHAMAE